MVAFTVLIPLVIALLAAPAALLAGATKPARASPVGTTFAALAALATLWGCLSGGGTLDVAWVHYLAESADRPVSEVMSKEVSSVELGKSEVSVAHKMVHDGASSVMVTENGSLVGLVNRLELYAAVVGIEA